MPHEVKSVSAYEYYIEGEVARKKISVTGDFEQAGQRYRTLRKVDQDHLVDNTADDLKKADKPIQKRMVDNLTEADPEFGINFT